MWLKFESLFGIVNKFRVLQLEAELTSLVPNYFPSIEDFFLNFKQQRSLLHNCGKNKTDT